MVGNCQDRSRADSKASAHELPLYRLCILVARFAFARRVRDELDVDPDRAGSEFDPDGSRLRDADGNAHSNRIADGDRVCFGLSLSLGQRDAIGSPDRNRDLVEAVRPARIDF